MAGRRCQRPAEPVAAAPGVNPTAVSQRPATPRPISTTPPVAARQARTSSR